MARSQGLDAGTGPGQVGAEEQCGLLSHARSGRGWSPVSGHRCCEETRGPSFPNLGQQCDYSIPAAQIAFMLGRDLVQ